MIDFSLIKFKTSKKLFQLKTKDENLKQTITGKDAVKFVLSGMVVKREGFIPEHGTGQSRRLAVFLGWKRD